MEGTSLLPLDAGSLMPVPVSDIYSRRVIAVYMTLSDLEFHFDYTKPPKMLLILAVVCLRSNRKSCTAVILTVVAKLKNCSGHRQSCMLV